MKKRKVKVKWGNIILIICASIIIHDLFMLSVYPLITGKTAGWTWFGFITFMTSILIIELLEDNKKDLRAGTHKSKM